MGEWRTVRIGDLGRVVTGRTPPGNDPDYYGNAVPFVTPSDMGDLRRVENPDRFLSDRGAAELNRCLVPQGVGVSCIGWKMGKAVLFDRPTITNQQINSIIVDPAIAEREFVYYSLRSKRYGLFALGAGGSRTPILNKGDFERQPFILPPLPVQRAIARILGTLDDKIELNRKMNDTLEAMARALFKSWFVEQLERADCRQIAVDELFAAGVLLVGDGYRAKNEELAPSGLPFARAGNIDNGFSFEGADFLGDPAVARAGDKVSRPFDVVFTSKGTVGRFAFVDSDRSPFVYSPQLCFWRTLDPEKLNPFVLYHWIRSRSFLDQVDRVKGQTDMAEYVSLRDQRRMVLHVPHASEQKRIAAQLSALQERIWANVAEIRTLVAIRDSLLPRLLSGELPTSGIEDSAEFGV